MPKPQLVKDFSEAQQNATKFSKMSNRSSSLALVRFSTFKNWYYFPEGDKSGYWGPSKFIGYRGTSLKHYSGQGHGGATTKTLQKWFDAIDPSSSKFEELRESLDNLAERLGKKLSSAINIHVPKYCNPIDDDLADKEPFEPLNDEDARNRVERSIAQRRGQAKFRNELLRAYENKCAITKCSVKTVLEAAHICPYRGDQSNNSANGILLRSDLHTLFDAHKLAIDPKKMSVLLAEHVRKDGSYPNLHGKKVFEPTQKSKRPSTDALKLHLSRFNESNS